jgi:uroporphyrinogen-III decarboxylase
MEWADNNNAQFQHYFLYVNLNRAVNDIRNGLVSPWVILNCQSGKDLVNKLNDEQLDIIAPALDVAYWVKKFKDNKADASLVKDVCKEAGIE